MIAVRYVGPHAEGVDITPITGGETFFDVKPGDVIDVPDELANGTAPELDDDGDIVTSGVQGLLESPHWEPAGTTKKSATVPPAEVTPEVTPEEQP